MVLFVSLICETAHVAQLLFWCILRAELDLIAEWIQATLEIGGQRKLFE